MSEVNRIEYIRRLRILGREYNEQNPHQRITSADWQALCTTAVEAIVRICDDNIPFPEVSLLWRMRLYGPMDEPLIRLTWMVEGVSEQKKYDFVDLTLGIFGPQSAHLGPYRTEWSKRGMFLLQDFPYRLQDFLRPHF